MPRRVLVASLITAVILWLVLSVIMQIYGTALVFQTHLSRATAYGVAAERVYIDLPSGDQAEVVIVPSTATGVILYFHGNVGRLGYILQQASAYGTVISPAYPGYSLSSGRPSPAGIAETVDGIFAFLETNHVPRSHVTVLGHSMGGYAAVLAAARYPDIKELLLVNAFENVRDICRRRFIVFCELTGTFLPTGRFAPDVTVSVRQWHTPRDRVVPYRSGKRLFELLGSTEKRFADIGGIHSEFPVPQVLAE